MPAITRVHECSKLETGVGPSMASGSHKNVSTLIDFSVSAKINNDIAKLFEQNSPNNPTITQSKITSPIRLKPIAENAEEVVNVRDTHEPMSAKLMNPTISQQRSKAKALCESKTIYTENKNPLSRNKNATNHGSNSR